MCKCAPLCPPHLSRDSDLNECEWIGISVLGSISLSPPSHSCQPRNCWRVHLLLTLSFFYLSSSMTKIVILLPISVYHPFPDNLRHFILGFHTVYPHVSSMLINKWYYEFVTCVEMNFHWHLAVWVLLLLPLLNCSKLLPLCDMVFNILVAFNLMLDWFLRFARLISAFCS